MITEVRDAYSRRSAEYVELFGSMEAVHQADRQLVSDWASEIRGMVVDAGCGPGHWTNYLAELGLTAHGTDLVTPFIERALETYPRVDFTVGSLDDLNAADASVGGILAWYSLIHFEPREIRIPLLEFRRVLRADGTLLIGLFEGATTEKFGHAVTPAYRWSVDDLGEELSAAGFEVIESHVRRDAGQRPHAAIVAQPREARWLPIERS